MPFLPDDPGSADALRPLSKLDTTALDAIVAGSAGTGVVSGCACTVSGTLGIAVASGVVRANGVRRVVTGATVTAVPDATHPRKFVVTDNGNGTPTIVHGTAAADPDGPAVTAGHVVIRQGVLPAGLTQILTSHFAGEAVTVLPALITLDAGAAGAGLAPLTFTSGTLQTTAEAGTAEYDGVAFYMSPVAGNRAVNAVAHIATNSADFTGTAGSAVQPIFQAANDRLTVVASTTYLFELFLSVTNGTTTATKALDFDGGTCTFTSMRYWAMGQNLAINTTGTTQSTIHVDTPAETVVLATGTSSWWIYAKGIVRINGGGTFLPQFKFSANPTGTVLIKKDSYMTLTPIGSNGIAAVGAWT